MLKAENLKPASGRAAARQGVVAMPNSVRPVSVLTFDTFQQRTEGEAERLKAGPPKT
jgi:hypothetical protein